MKKILFIICLLIAYCTSFGQVYYDSTKILDPVYGAGFQYNNIRIKGALWLGDTTRLAVKDSNSLAIHNHKPYLWNGYNWIELSTGTSTCFDGLKAGTGAVAEVNDTTFTVADATFYLDCTDYQTQDTTIRIVAPGDTNRIDGIFGNKNTGLVDYVKGTESISGTLPNYDPTYQFPYAFILTGPAGVVYGTYIDSNFIKIGDYTKSLTGKLAIGGNIASGSGLAVLIQGGNAYICTNPGEWAQIGGLRAYGNGNVSMTNLPASHNVNDSMLVRNASNGLLGYRAIPAGGGGSITDGSGTTANGTAVDLGGTATQDIAIDADGVSPRDFLIGENEQFRTINIKANTDIGIGTNTAALSLRTAPGTMYINGIDSLDSPYNMLWVDDNHIVHKAAVPSGGGGSGVSPSDLADSMQVMRDSIAALRGKLDSLANVSNTLTVNPDQLVIENDTLNVKFSGTNKIVYTDADGYAKTSSNATLDDAGNVLFAGSGSIGGSGASGLSINGTNSALGDHNGNSTGAMIRINGSAGTVKSGDVDGNNNLTNTIIDDDAQTFSIQAANGTVINGTTPDASSALDIQSTTKGFLIPRLDLLQRGAISSPAIGLQVYQTDENEGLYMYKSDGWEYVDGPSTPVGSSLVSGNIWVGNGSNEAASVSVSGDVSMSNAGEFTIGAGKVSNSMLAGSIAYSKLVNYSAYTRKANNTNSAATPSDVVYKSFSNLSYSGTVTWATSGSAPSGTPVVRYSWRQDDKDVDVTFTVYCPTPGTSVTGVTLTLPTDMPNPLEPTGTGAADDILYPGCGFITTNYATDPTVAARVSLKINSTDNGYEFKVTSSSLSARYATFSLHYKAQ